MFVFVTTGRLLRANQIIFNWDRLASWINLTEEWPYRTSWLILFLEENDVVSDQVTLKTIYERSDGVPALQYPSCVNVRTASSSIPSARNSC